MSSNDEKKKEIMTDLRFDDGFPDGVMTLPSSTNKQKVKVRALFEFCKKKTFPYWYFQRSKWRNFMNGSNTCYGENICFEAIGRKK